jgi:hypothetical protein
MAERTFFVRGEVRVTDTSIHTRFESLPMSGINSVKARKKDPSRVGPVLLGVTGVLALFLGRYGVVAAILLITAAISWWVLQKPVYSIIVNGPAGQRTALSSNERGYVASVIGAVNDAIVERKGTQLER